MAKTIVVDVKHIFKSYLIGNEKFIAINDVSFQIESGKFIIFFGPSGCGKSTLLNMISGLETIDKGTIKIRGEDISKFSPNELAKYRRTKIGIVYQQFNLIKDLTITENVALPLLADGRPKAQAINRAHSLLRTFGLGDHLNKKPTELSGGQQQKVAMARALAANPWIIIADEPTGNLDSKSAEEIINILNILNKKSRRTIIMVTHNPEYLKIAHQVMYMKDGKIVREQKNPNPKGVSEQIKGFNLKDLEKTITKEQK